jgi:phosphoglycolate phosphatase
MIFFDLDGPLLDVSPRYVALHHDLLRELGREGMPAATYWQRKRARVPEERILEEIGAGDLAGDYLPRRLGRIETPEYLRFDCAWPWAHETLAALRRQHTLVIVTARAQRVLLLDQLDRLGLTPFFEEILSMPAGDRVDRQKARLIGDFLVRHGLDAEGWMVGDTEADIGAGRLVGLGTVGVLTGIRDRQFLLPAEPDHLLADIRELGLVVGPLPKSGPAGGKA